MITPTYEELQQKGFLVLQGGNPPEYLGRELNQTYILAKHLIDKTYEIHAAKDSIGKGYNSIEINSDGTFDSITTLDELIEFLENPKKSRLQLT